MEEKKIPNFYGQKPAYPFDNAYYFKHGCFHGHRTLCETYKPVESFPNAQVLNRKNESPLMELGTVGGKSYYEDRILRNLHDSRNHCKSQGLKLAAVTSGAQSRFLKSASTKINYDGWFWITERPKQSSQEEDNKCPLYSPQQSRRLKNSCNREHFTLCESWGKQPESRGR
ncbi:C-type lectin domain family 4 member F [Orchesella cincta]|uniref:C-type lectin domain family 4 member F n=1 Tax=Orchesella cincta TaxID=48709 RepID=A0A1D2MSK0_ORCCI|nr:C-type lectin domain family 4 member F [Orchesella cincta]